MRKIIVVFLMLLSMVYVGCKKSTDSKVTPQSNCDGIDSRFSAKVFPLIQNTCATNIGCHASGSSNGPGALTNYTQISNASASIKTAVVSGVMPRGSTLSTNEKSIITCWVSSGAPNN